MEYILVSSCLLGAFVRYNGGNKRCDHEIIQRWQYEGRLVSICPEVDGGLPVPRPPAEIAGGAGGFNVLETIAKVFDSTGHDVSLQFIEGAKHALVHAKTKNIRIAVLKEGSPSCGSSYTYDGTFSSIQVSQPGVTTALLRQAVIHVFSETQLEEADRLVKRFESG
jgi:uncharacterized protein YbbK (DUF523 family)